MTHAERERLIYEKMIQFKQQIQSAREADPELSEDVSFCIRGDDEIANEAARRLMSEGLTEFLLKQMFPKEPPGP